MRKKPFPLRNLLLRITAEDEGQRGLHRDHEQHVVEVVADGEGEVGAADPVLKEQIVVVLEPDVLGVEGETSPLQSRKLTQAAITMGIATKTSSPIRAGALNIQPRPDAPWIGFPRLTFSGPAAADAASETIGGASGDDDAGAGLIDPAPGTQCHPPRTPSPAAVVSAIT